ncbi:hypothetical protein TRIUR3_29527 [Triticum urartu]|uniref:Uncharacterized protein n=1 Tax=Triticum urartu TaxID=4572 RepID=M7ZYK6_TRIUA|nr:hypothetical protein TRIUR3_29527 [Triticum urartu]
MGIMPLQVQAAGGAEETMQCDDRCGGAVAGLPDEPRQDQVIIGAVAAAVQVGGVAATFGGASAAAPKGNLHQTLPHNSASKCHASCVTTYICHEVHGSGTMTLPLARSFGGGDPCDGDSLQQFRFRQWWCYTATAPMMATHWYMVHGYANLQLVVHTYSRMLVSPRVSTNSGDAFIYDDAL